MRIPTDEDLNNVITTYAGNEKFSWLADIARELQTTRAQLAEAQAEVVRLHVIIENMKPKRPVYDKPGSEAYTGGGGVDAYFGEGGA